jgi:molybdate transport system substrate-binding protein
MKRIIGLLIAFLSLSTAWSAGVSETGGNQGETRNLTVGAAASLSDALDEAIKIYSAENPSIKIVVIYGSSGALQKQIEQGAPIDAFISASPKQVDALAKAGLIEPGSRRTLLENELVLVVPSGSAVVRSWQDLAGKKVARVALGEPSSVPAGQYAAETLSALGLREAVTPKAAYAKDVREALAYVASGDADAGVVYATDAKGSDRVRVVAAAPAGSHSPILYPACAIASSRELGQAKRFLDWLSGPRAAKAFGEYGFVVKDR